MPLNTKKLADAIVSKSLAVAPLQRVFIDVVGEADSLIDELITSIYSSGGIPFLHTVMTKHLKRLLQGSHPQQIKLMAKQRIYQMKTMNAYIGIRSTPNLYEMNDVDEERYKLYINEYLQPIQATMASLDHWILLQWPTEGAAQLAGMSLESFKSFYFQASSLDYEQLREKAEPLQHLLDHTDKVRITSPGTDLTFSINNIPSFLCMGKYNLPDGEIFTAPVLHSTEGYIQFNIPGYYMGKLFHNVSLEFRKGRVVNASSDNMTMLNSILNTDNGACYLGEFGIGLNPAIIKPTNSLIFDEKMNGSIHLALGQAYPMADNGNNSSIHWDLVLMQSKNYGGGALYFDGILIREDGLFILPELKHLNEE
ncbi:aminopeptidase [Paenibacillus cellulosilyticus]|uniref:Aminopeptidase n=1 Tax=Paenibacillus cellulosilyticus TaxID=375489 RepID=A0A2V2YVG7_9BACL|nr:aminopeptidase [Paenibacillus cellulosilyticus]PWW03205.1 aminopeptidase [Paenibacillus cellulosilyticus]QKS43695.1 aminopeptidase [Paenibacillus cellulosilyticus]